MFRLLALIPFAATLQAVDFQKDVAPVLEKRCQMCHGAQQQMSNLRLDNAAGAARVVVAGKSAQSKLMERVRSTKGGFRMPPVGEPLAAKDIDNLAVWIDAGAVWPADYRAGGRTSHWSFQPVSQKALPKVKQQGWVKNPIDAFVLARLEAEGLHRRLRRIRECWCGA